MESALRAIETTGTVDERRQLHLDEPLPVAAAGKVRVIVLISEEDAEDEEWSRAAATNPAFGFLNDPEEDVYTPEDGRSFGDQG
ncbi:MAG: hypothetical protein WA990_13760 [Rubrobacteraceae bacterium]